MGLIFKLPGRLMVGHQVLVLGIGVRIPARQHMWFVYILKSLIKRWYYVGSTNRLNKRLYEHNKGLVKSTKFYKPFKLVYVKEFKTEHEAREYEKKLKQCRMEKEKIIKQIKEN